MILAINEEFGTQYDEAAPWHSLFAEDPVQVCPAGCISPLFEPYAAICMQCPLSVVNWVSLEMQTAYCPLPLWSLPERAYFSLFCIPWHPSNCF